MKPVLIDIRNLRHAIQEGTGSRTILDNVNLSVRTGEAVALLGRSGSGKSTLLNLVSGIDKAGGGEIRISGQDICTMGEPQLTLFRREQIGIIYQFFHLVSTLTVAENIALALELNRWLPQQIRARVTELLQLVGLTGLAERFPDQLSGGEQQRVAIARALAHRPALVLADEPTGNLDAQIGREVLTLLTQLVAQEGVTLIMVTHSQAVAQSADRVLTLEQGRLTEQAGEFAW